MYLYRSEGQGYLCGLLMFYYVSGCKHKLLYPDDSTAYDEVLHSRYRRELSGCDGTSDDDYDEAKDEDV
jgi:hypothetical protein